MHNENLSVGGIKQADGKEAFPVSSSMHYKRGSLTTVKINTEQFSGLKTTSGKRIT